MKSRWMFIVVSVLLAMLNALEPVTAQVPGPQDEREHALRCIDMVEAQLTGSQPGSACSVPALVMGSSVEGPGVLSALYRRGSTHKWTSQSDSDLVEDVIKVQGYLYWWVNNSWHYEDQCSDNKLVASRAVCRTYGGGATNKSEGWHHFQKSGYANNSFWTYHLWWSP